MASFSVKKSLVKLCCSWQAAVLVGGLVVAAGEAYAQMQGYDYLPYRTIITPSVTSSGAIDPSKPGTPGGKDQAFFEGLVPYYFNTHVSFYSGNQSDQLATDLGLTMSHGVINYTPSATRSYAAMVSSPLCQTITTTDAQGNTFDVPNEKMCLLTLTGSSDPTTAVHLKTLPVIVVDGSSALRAKPLTNMIAAQVQQNSTTPMTLTNPEIISVQPGASVDMSQFFYAQSVPKGATNVVTTYDLTPEHVCPISDAKTPGNLPIPSGLTTLCKQTGGIFKMNTLGTLPSFTKITPTTSKGPTFNAPDEDGMYQVDVKVVSHYSLNNTAYQSQAYQTFYIKVGDPASYFNKRMGMVYSYLGGDNPQQQINDYVGDISHINKDLMRSGNSINEDISSIGQLNYITKGTNSDSQTINCDPENKYNPAGYQSACPFWSTKSLNTPYNALLNKAGAFMVHMSPSDRDEVSEYNQAFQTYNNQASVTPLRLTLDFERPKDTQTPEGDALSAEFTSMNQQQMDYLASAYVNEILPYANYNGVSTDFETGFDNYPVVNYFFKNLADRLAFAGKYMGMYDFPNRAFFPPVVAAMAPDGVGIFSAYGGSTHRAPNSSSVYSYNTNLAGALSLQSQGLSPDEADFYAKMLFPDVNCGYVQQGTGYLMRGHGGCVATLYGAKSGNNLMWTATTKYGVTNSASPHVQESAYNLFKQMGMHFAPDLPIAQSDSQSPYYVFLNDPVIKSLSFLSADKFTAKSSLQAVMSPSCTSEPTTLAGVQKCLGESDNLAASWSWPTGSSVPFQVFGSCPADMNSFSTCMMMSGPVKFINTEKNGTTGGYQVTNISNYLNHDADVYRTIPSQTTSDFYGSTAADNPNMVGYVMFALGGVQTEASHSCNTFTGGAQNTRCNEPWYVGFSSQIGDPFYQAYEQSSEHAAAVAPLVNIDNAWRTVNNLLTQMNPAATTAEYWPTVSWAGGLPITAIQDNGSSLQGTFTENAALINAPTTDAVTYQCYVLSHGIPSGTCTITPPSSGSDVATVNVTGADSLDYAVFVVAGDKDNTAITKNSVYIPIVHASTTPVLHWGSAPLSKPVVNGSSATINFMPAYLTGVTGNPEITYSCHVTGDDASAVSCQAITDPSNAYAHQLNLTGLPSGGNVTIALTASADGQSATSNSISIGPDTAGAKLSWTVGNPLGQFTRTGSTATASLTSPLLQNPPTKSYQVSYSCLLNGVKASSSTGSAQPTCVVSGAQPVYKQTTTGTVTISGLTSSQAPTVQLVVQDVDHAAQPVVSNASKVPVGGGSAGPVWAPNALPVPDRKSPAYAEAYFTQATENGVAVPLSSYSCKLDNAAPGDYCHFFEGALPGKAEVAVYTKTASDSPYVTIIATDSKGRTSSSNAQRVPPYKGQ